MDAKFTIMDNRRAQVNAHISEIAKKDIVLHHKMMENFEYERKEQTMRAHDLDEIVQDHEKKNFENCKNLMQAAISNLEDQETSFCKHYCRDFKRACCPNRKAKYAQRDTDAKPVKILDRDDFLTFQIRKLLISDKTAGSQAKEFNANVTRSIEEPIVQGDELSQARQIAPVELKI